jgi:hypothetical protein
MGEMIVCADHAYSLQRQAAAPHLPFFPHQQDNESMKRLSKALFTAWLRSHPAP